jgi:hydroxymethylbilane synthase
MARRPDLIVQDLRGNLDSRLGKLEHGQVDAAVLALAGVRRLGREDAVGETLDPPEWLPAAGQGAIAVVTRSEDGHLRGLMSRLDDADTRTVVTAERSLLKCLHGGCQIPIGALAVQAAREVTLFGFVGQTDGTRIVRAERTGSADEAIALGEALARELEQRGAREIIAEARRSLSAPAVSAP